MLRRLLLLATGLAAVLGTGCSDMMAKKEPPFEFVINVSSDPGRVVAGAEITLPNGKVLRTDASGSVKARFSGHQGDRISAPIKCPERYDQPLQPISITLYRLAPGAPAPSYEAQCIPTYRHVIAAVRAINGSGLPIVRLGQTLGHTDASGASHLAIDAKPGEQVELLLDTSSRELAALRPRSPTVTFVVPSHDDLVVLGQEFTIEKEPVKVKKKIVERRATEL